MFTVFLQGGTIKLFVNCLHIDKKSEEHVNLTEEINRKLFEHVMTGVSDIIKRICSYEISADRDRVWEARRVLCSELVQGD